MLPTSTSSVVDAAVAYVEAGFNPIPVFGVRDDGTCLCGAPDCKAPGKHPVGNGWQRRKADLDTVRDLFASHRGNVGLSLGGSPYVVVDFDGPVGLRTRDALAAEGLLPETMTAASGGGGAHYLFVLASWHSAEEITDRRVGPGWDVKKRGQFLVAPSRHRSGGMYEWISDAPVATLPDALYQRIRKQTRAPAIPSSSSRVDRARAYVAKMPAAISGAGGHDATFAVARKLVQDFELGEADAWALLCEYNQRCEPPWSDRELRHKLDDATRARVANPVQDRPRPMLHTHGSAALAAVPVPPASAPEADWRQRLLYSDSRTGKPKLVSACENVVRVLTHHPQWVGRVRFDELRGRTVVASPPWSEYQRATFASELWSDEDDVRLMNWLRAEFHHLAFAPALADCRAAVDIVARANAFHPLREYLEGLRWDGVRRLETAAATYLGTPDDEYHRKALAWWLTSAVARAFQPGCKADLVLVLEGEQGLGKSTALQILASPAWFTDSPIDLNSKDAFERLRGQWIVELAELDSLKGAAASRAKMFFSSSRDDYRAAYGRRAIEQPRTCVFAGTTNDERYLDDPTGARRFLPMRCVRIDHAALRRDRDQLWAEVVALYQGGARWYPLPEERELLADVQADRTDTDSWEARIVAWMGRQWEANVEAVTIEMVLERAMGLEPKDHSRAAQVRAGRAVGRAKGWLRRRVMLDGVRGYRYERAAKR